jgi:type VI protein secretion system component VasK
LEWEKSLGWLNIRAERRAKAALRWIGYGIYALLALALLGIVWAAEGLQALGNWSDPWVLGDLALRIPALGICLGMWMLYLGGWLMPKLRAEREEAGLKRFRAEAEEAEEAREKQPRSRIQAPLRKPRTNAPLLPDRTRRRR